MVFAGRITGSDSVKEGYKSESCRSKKVAGVGEKMQYCVHDLNDNTVRFSLRYPCQISSEIMGRAVLMVVKSVDILHASFETDKKDAFWRINEEVCEADCFVCLYVKDDLEPAMKQALIKPIAANDKTQLFCTLIQGKGESILVLNISHLCVDGSDGKYLLMKLLQAYQLLAENTDTEEFRVKDGSRSAFQIYDKLSRKEYFSAMIPKLSKVKSEFPFEKKGTGMKQIVIQTISAEVMEKARRRGRSMHATVNDLLLAACYKAYSTLPEVEENMAMSILSMMDLRCHCVGGQSQGLCNMSGPLSTELKKGAGTGFEQILMEVCRQTRKEKENPISGLHGMPLLHTLTKTVPYGLVLKIAKKVYGSFTIGMTNLGNFESKSLMIEGNEPISCLFAGPLKKKPGMQVSAVGLNGEVTLCCIGEYSKADAEKISRMLENMDSALKAFGEE